MQLTDPHFLDMIYHSYPSGLLAILVTVTAYGRVCIVFDDAPGQPMRALFQSDGKGTCYHPNGNIWYRNSLILLYGKTMIAISCGRLIINKYEGQCLDSEGARVRRWTWHKLGSTPLKPIFLFINKSIGIRVLGKQQIFVSFLANSRQARFNVGAWCCKVYTIHKDYSEYYCTTISCAILSFASS